jgi:hypothetical protein
MSFAPEFIANRDGNTLAEALARLLGGSLTGGLAEAGVQPGELAIPGVDTPNLLCPSWDTFIRHEFEAEFSFYITESIADV